MGLVPSSAFLVSTRPSSSHSAPPCTPMPSDEDRPDDTSISGGRSWCEPASRWDRSAASLGSLDSALVLSGSNSNTFGFNARLSETTKAMTLSQESVHLRAPLNTSRFQSPTRHEPIAAPNVRMHSLELLTHNALVSTNLRKCLTRPLACLLVLGGKTQNQTETGRVLDIWRCDIDLVGMVLI